MSTKVFDRLYPTDELVNAIGEEDSDEMVRVLMTCLVKGYFTLSSGTESNFKFVLDDFMWRLGKERFVKNLWDFAVFTLGDVKGSMVHGVPVGGERIANELYIVDNDLTSGFILFDDVLTSGRSFYKYFGVIVSNLKESNYKGGIVILDRLSDRNKRFKEKCKIFSMVNIKY